MVRKKNARCFIHDSRKSVVYCTSILFREDRSRAFFIRHRMQGSFSLLKKKYCFYRFSIHDFPLYIAVAARMIPFACQNNKLLSLPASCRSCDVGNIVKTQKISRRSHDGRDARTPYIRQ